MAKYMVLKHITINHRDSNVSETYPPGRIVELEDYTATVLLAKQCIKPAALKPRKGIIKLEELKHGTNNE